MAGMVVGLLRMAALQFGWGDLGVPGLDYKLHDSNDQIETVVLNMLWTVYNLMISAPLRPPRPRPARCASRTGAVRTCWCGCRVLAPRPSMPRDRGLSEGGLKVRMPTAGLRARHPADAVDGTRRRAAPLQRPGRLPQRPLSQWPQLRGHVAGAADGSGAVHLRARRPGRACRDRHHPDRPAYALAELFSASACAAARRSSCAATAAPHRRPRPSA